MEPASILGILGAITAAASTATSAATAGASADERKGMLDYNIWKDSIDWGRNEERYQQMRQDSQRAYQYKVQDLKAAGLSPVLATGSPASAPILSTPQMTDAVGNYQKPPIDLSSAMQVPQMIMQAIKMNDELTNTRIQREVNQEKIKQIQAETALTSMKYGIDKHNLKLAENSSTPVGGVTQIEGAKRMVDNAIKDILDKVFTPQEQEAIKKGELPFKGEGGKYQKKGTSGGW